MPPTAAGADSISGGDGNDTYYVDNTDDRVIETNSDPVSGGIDSVHSRLASYTLGDNVENLYIDSPGAANGTGNALDNTLFAGAGNNVLDGRDGNDGVTVNLSTSAQQNTVGAGLDTLKFFENLTGSAYADHLTGNSGANVLNGGAGNDTLVGGAGDDRLIGGEGSDNMTGGTGADTVAPCRWHSLWQCQCRRHRRVRIRAAGCQGAACRRLRRLNRRNRRNRDPGAVRTDFAPAPGPPGSSGRYGCAGSHSFAACPAWY